MKEKEATITKQQKDVDVEDHVWPLFSRLCTRRPFLFQGPISLAFTDLKPKDVLDSATERSKKERGREGLSSTFASKGRGLNRSMLRMKAAESYVRLLS